MRPELKRAVTLVRKGASYTEAATKCGITRNSVAGACSRAGLITGRPFISSDGSRTRLACDLYRKGLKYREIAAIMHLSSPRAVHGYLLYGGEKTNRNAKPSSKRAP